jgi:mono/diheme cytochrome c family protein
MKRLARWSLGLLGLLALIVAGAVAFLLLFRPKVRPPSTEVVERTPERLARGTYLMEHLLPCIGCHSQGDGGRFGLPIREGMAFAGGIVLDRSFEGFPGVVQAPNITPDPETGIGDWTDGEVMRAIREGIHRDGHTLFPNMPYYAMAAMSDEDLRSVVTYLRALRPVRQATLPVEIDFPVNLLIRLEPEPVEGPVHAPDPTDSVAYGGYLVRLAGCKLCHTPFDKGQLLDSEAFSGGREFATPDGRMRVVTTNITPDPTGYFGQASRDQWISRVRTYVAVRQDPPAVEPGFNTMMPWLEYAGLTDEDLGAIHDYMQTVAPIRKVVRPYPSASR